VHSQASIFRLEPFVPPKCDILKVLLYWAAPHSNICCQRLSEIVRNVRSETEIRCIVLAYCTNTVRNSNNANNVIFSCVLFANIEISCQPKLDSITIPQNLDIVATEEIH